MRRCVLRFPTTPLTKSARCSPIAAASRSTGGRPCRMRFMPRFKKAYGWKDGDKFYLSLLPREAGAAANIYASPSDALRDAHPRGLAIEWDDSAEIATHGRL